MVIIIETFKYMPCYLMCKMEEKSVFVEYFGDYPLIRVLDFLVLSRDMDYSMTEIAKNSNVGWTAFSEIWPQLIKKEIVIFTRKIGNAKLFKLNLKNFWVKELIRMDKIITKIETKKILSKEKVTA
jgi:predicted transcriptional regulator